MLYLGIFELEFKIAKVIVKVDALKFVWLQRLVQNKNFWPKMPYFGVFGPQFQKSCCHIWNQHKNALFGYFWARVLKKLLSYLKSAPSNLSISNFTKKQNYLNLGAKMPDLGIFMLQFESNIAIFEISTLEFA